MSDMHNQQNNTKTQTAQDEAAVLHFWQENSIFEKSIEQREGMEEFVFFDGPPFATGLPHYGHILPGTIKDAIPRYQTMQGKKVVRKWGWDCHGLPIENIVEKELNLNSRKDILDYGIANFNRDCANQVLKFKEQWEEIIPKTGRWVDMEDHYKTMDPSYTESCWWAFKQLHKKGLVYRGFKPMHLCPRCETTLSNNEVAEGYKDITDISVTVKFELNDMPGTYILAWTTTPWTLPGNTAIAVGTGVTYAKVKVDTERGVEHYILAQARVADVMAHAGIEQYEEVEVMSAEALIGRSYTPPYAYYSHNDAIENHANGWKVYGVDFVTDDAGTGIAHEAPAFGADDFYMAQKEGIPVVHHVGTDGRFKPEVSDFAGAMVKEKGDHQAVDIEIIKSLAGLGLLFSKEKIVHSYPHCWRCDTPLLNYAASSWFIKTTDLRKRMLEENNDIEWVPDHLGHKRFHNWIENNVDWAVSRSRFWGAPLPIWENQTTGDYEVIGGLDEIKTHTRSTNNFMIIRHGESISNVEHTVCSTAGHAHDALTENGKEQVSAAVAEVTKLLGPAADQYSDAPKVDVIVVSPFTRTKQTAAILAEALGVTEVVEDDRLRERHFGIYDGGPNDAYFKARDEQEVGDDFNFSVPEGESMYEVKDRMMQALYELDGRYEGKNILIVTHFSPYWVSFAGVAGMNTEQALDLRNHWGEIHNAFPRKLDFAPIPHNEHYELDFHRPYSDAITWKNEKGEDYKMIGEVFDCWYESGSMPFASKHYMGDDSDTDFTYPADFISEAVDQTRGWFYSLLALGAGVFDQAPMKNVIVTGHVMAEDGKKMSKSLKNYPPVEEVLDKYGADALRFFLLNSPVMRGEQVNLAEKSIDEIVKKITMRMKNVATFYAMYAPEGSDIQADPGASTNPLDRWVMARLNQVIEQVTVGMDNYELDRACAPILDFVDDFSTWYVRRSRDRFKGTDAIDREFAQATTWYVLRTMAKVLAPSMPFLAEHLWQQVRVDRDQISVHLEPWPKIGDINTEAVTHMQSLRDIVSTGLDARVVAKIKVRQPLAKLTVKALEGVTDLFTEDMTAIIADELNVKEVIFADITEAVELDTAITPELQTEGDFREFVRQIQSMRKAMKLEPQDNVHLHLEIGDTGRAMVDQYFSQLSATAGVTKVIYGDVDAEEQNANEVTYKAVIEKK